MSDDMSDLLSPEEIEALMQAARGEGAGGASAGLFGPPGGAASPAGASPRQAHQPASRNTSAEQSLRQAEQQLAAALSEELPPRNMRGLPPGEAPARFEFEEFGTPFPTRAAAPVFPLDALQDVELDIRIELGRTELLIDEVMQLREGAVVPLDKLAGDPVDILVNGKLLARGEVLVLNDNFCVRIAEILTQDG
ncbi:flagellar motor switch protein FliN [Planctopirus limnophila]|nr:flagellar motor switch protein FliN [Planctopirus limnophila]